MASPETKLSLSEKLSFSRAVLATVFLAAWTTALHFIQPKDDSPGLARSVYTMVLRSLSSLPQRQRNALPRPPTSVGIENYCKRKKVIHFVDDLPKSAKLHWIGPRSSEGNILLYFHGGGYNNPIVGPGHVPFAMKCAAKASASLAMLEYTLAPTARYPIQLQQAAAALKHILTIRSPSKIIIAGDSAGGHLAAGLLSHINHPSKDIEPLNMAEELKGFCFISPFLSFDYNKESYRTNATRDYLTLDAIKEFNENFKPPELSNQDAIQDPQLSPFDAPRGWWEGSPVRSILLVVGSWEAFLDDCVSFGRRLQEAADSGTKVDVVQGSKEPHAACIVDQLLGLGHGDSAKVILAWMLDLGPCAGD